MEYYKIRRVIEGNKDEIIKPAGWDNFQSFLDELRITASDVIDHFLDVTDDSDGTLSSENDQGLWVQVPVKTFQFGGGRHGRYLTFENQTVVMMRKEGDEVAYINEIDYERCFC